MSSNKRRKLNGGAPQLSAFAARQKIVRTKTSTQDAAIQKQEVEIKDSADFITLGQGLEESGIKYGLADASNATATADAEGEERDSDEDKEKFDSEDEPDSSLQSRAESIELLLEAPAIVLSTFKPSKANVKGGQNDSLILKIAPGERLVILGQYDLTVRKGQIALLGASLKPSKTSYRVFAPSTHSLPVLRCVATDINEAEIELGQCESGLELLQPLSPLYGKLWNDGSGPLGSAFKNILNGHSRSTFQILFSTKDGPEKAYLQPIISTPEWNQALSKLSTPESQKGYAVIICGPKGSGKSTFAKLLTNRLLSSTTPTTATRRPIGVAILDLDPGQPEYSPQGQISLIHVQEPNFGTPFTHPVPAIPNRLVRAHTIGAITPSLDPDLYISCALDLFKHYRNLLTDVPGCPLIINTPGWVLGTGLEILVELISKMQPTEVMYMSQEGPSEVVGSLKEASKKTPVFTLPSQVSEYTTRTAAHLRTMQAMSYFHLNSQPTKELVWDGRPLTCVPPWEIKYSGEGAGILGILCYGEQPPPDLLLEAINGTLVAVVVIEDMAAIPGWDSESEDSMGGDLVLQTNNVEALSRPVNKPLIIRTAEENLPYFNNLNTILLSPSHSYCLGLALIRGIDVKRQRLQVLTPILPSEIFAISNEGKKIVLVSGKFDTPGWAYIEALNRKDEKKKAAKKAAMSESEEMGEADGSDEEMEDPQKGGGMERFAASGTEEVPWVEKLKGSQGRGVGARVWRVRRDLGRSGDGD